MVPSYMVNEVDASDKDVETPPIVRCATWQPPPRKFYQVYAGGTFTTPMATGDTLVTGKIYSFGAKRFKVIREHQTAAAAAAEAAARAAAAAAAAGGGGGGML